MISHHPKANYCVTGPKTTTKITHRACGTADHGIVKYGSDSQVTVKRAWCVAVGREGGGGGGGGRGECQQRRSALDIG